MSRLLTVLLSCSLYAAPVPVLIVDGQNNHNWRETTPLLKRYLEETKLFQVDVATSPEKGGDWSNFKPDFKKYKAVISNYSDFNGDPWPESLRRALTGYVHEGGAFVSVHAANNAFPMDAEYNKMIALGGWGGRTEKDGPYATFQDGKLVFDHKPGRGGHHGKRHAFKITFRDTRHPITRGLPAEWLHAIDELYDLMRGPAQNMHLLATAFSDPEQGGTGNHEPLIFTVAYGKGRVFHTMLGHDVEAMRCVGFITTYQRGVEWAATGKVTQKPPADFPAPDRVSLR